MACPLEFLHVTVSTNDEKLVPFINMQPMEIILLVSHNLCYKAYNYLHFIGKVPAFHRK